MDGILDLLIWNKYIYQSFPARSTHRGGPPDDRRYSHPIARMYLKHTKLVLYNQQSDLAIPTIIPPCSLSLTSPWIWFLLSSQTFLTRRAKSASTAKDTLTALSVCLFAKEKKRDKLAIPSFFFFFLAWTVTRTTKGAKKKKKAKK